VVPLDARTAGVVMSHHVARDTDYLAALLEARVGYVGALGPRSRTERMLGELAARGETLFAAASAAGGPLHAPVGLDLGGDGPEAIALAVVAEVAAMAHGRSGGFLRDRPGALHEAAPHDAARHHAPGARTPAPTPAGPALPTG
jgi:xanthine dehydrogenase accessory factor